MPQMSIILCQIKWFWKSVMYVGKRIRDSLSGSNYVPLKGGGVPKRTTHVGDPLLMYKCMTLRV